MEWYGGLAYEAVVFLEKLELHRLLEGQVPAITGRPKTVDTLTEKLKRQPTYQLGNIQGVAGARVEARMNLIQQDTLVNHVVASHEQIGVPCEVSDLRDDDHSGYRAVHVIVKPPGSRRFEIQFRTMVQSRWANTYEALADVVGRDIRYGSVPQEQVVADAVELMQALSRDLAKTLEDSGVTLISLEQRGMKANTDKDLAEMVRQHEHLMSQYEEQMENMETTLRQIGSELGGSPLTPS
ncbi:hypothetical protein [Rothia halotolerans]|uniref:hypothetical protein n=1 Tax=Rothia halotolerans TaxID=405770 RepID=UPI0013E9B58A|nr:hypothetical protein [Rothia halotolerans]